jgi:glyoxylase-like metal-dependent hydrolase (beta-lactamase superfamily II)
MHGISKRQFVISAAAAGAAFGLDGPLAFIPPAEAQKAPPSNPIGAPQALVDKGVAKFKVGDIEVIQLFDGIAIRPHDPGFIKNASVDETKAALKAAGLSDENVPNSFTITVVKMKGKTIMFDSGTGAQLAPTAGLIVKNDLLKKAGIDPAKISTIIVTHFHGDHITGLMAKDTNAQIFPNAEIIVPASEYKYWTDPAVTAGAAKRIQAVFPGWKNIRQYEGDKEVVPGVKPINTNGHSPGHMSYLLGSGRRQLIVLGDVAIMPSLFVRNPGWHVAFDADANLAEQNRRKIFDRAVADKATVTGYHFGFPGAGTLKKDGKGYAFVPVKAT